MSAFNVEAARARFPALKQDQVFLENAGGSQTLDSVIDSITQYLSKTNVQLGATYRTSTISTTKYGEGYDAAAKYINAHVEEVVVGSSTTQLFMNLSGALKIPAGSEIILSKMEHETNVKPWLHMADRLGLTVKWWESPKPELKLAPENLKPLLSDKVKFVACTHVSNLIGTIHDIKAIADAVHSVGALFCVDGVSFAPHRQVDVKAFGIDFYSFSWYKVYGPHIGVLYASNEAQKHIVPQNHFFNPSKSLQDKLGFAGSNYEATQALPPIVDYLGGDNPKAFFAGVAEHESKLSKIILEFLTSREDITVHDSVSSDSNVRVPTISFTVKDKNSQSIVDEVEKLSNYGLRAGHMYSKRLCDEVLGLGEDAVVRCSAVHYNTEEEVRGLVEILKKVIS